MSNNPLKQYFRRPVLYIQIPKNDEIYSEEHVVSTNNNEHAVYPMTMIDEITSKTPDALYNGQAMVDIIKSCVPDIKDPWQLHLADINHILIAIKIASSGDFTDISSDCPQCNEENTFSVDLSKLLNSQKSSSYTESLKVGDIAIKFRSLTYKESNTNTIKSFELQKQIVQINSLDADDAEKIKMMSNINKELQLAIFNTIVDSIEWIKASDVIVTEKEYIREFIFNTDKRVISSISEYCFNLFEGNKIQPLHVNCTHCNHAYKQQIELNASDFFE